MTPYLLGLSHHTAPVALRERLAFQAGEEMDLLEAATSEIQEGVLISTCNRTEVYYTAEDGERARERLVELMLSKGSLHPSELLGALYFMEGERAVRHLFRVVSGLDALVVGETQIIGQVKASYEAARRAGLAGREMSPLFQQAFAVAKRVQTETEVGRSAVSVGYAAVELAKKVFGRLRGKTALLLGAGELAELCLAHLKSQGVGRVYVANRSLDHAVTLARTVGATAVPFTGVADILADADIVIGSTSAPHAVLDALTIAQVIQRRGPRPLFLFDMAVPRDFEPEAKGLPGVFLYDIDDLRTVVAANRGERARQASSGERLVEEAARSFVASQKARRAVPLIRSLRVKVDEIRRAELEKALRRMPDITPREREILEAMTALLVKKILNDPTIALKDLAGQSDGDVYLATAAKLFNLDVPRETALDKADGA